MAETAIEKVDIFGDIFQSCEKQIPPSDFSRPILSQFIIAQMPANCVFVADRRQGKFHMNNRLFLAALSVVLFCTSPAKGEFEIGVVGQSGWSDNFYLANPDGWGITIANRPSPSFAIRFSFSRFESLIQYSGIMQFGFPPIDINTPREQIDSEASTNLYELTLHYSLLNGRKLRLEAGGGFGISDFDLNLVGTTTNRIMSTAQSPFILTLSVDATVKKLLNSPFALRFGYQYRTMGALPVELDGFQPFNNVNLSEVRVAILARL